MTRWQRHMVANLFMSVCGWMSLMYGWGLTPVRWYVILGYALLIAVGLHPVQVWVLLGRSSNDKQHTEES